MLRNVWHNYGWFSSNKSVDNFFDKNWNQLGTKNLKKIANFSYNVSRKCYAVALESRKFPFKI